MTDLAVAPNQMLTADEVEVSNLYDEDKIPAGATNAVEVVSQVDDPAALSYIVTTRSEDGEAAEVLTVGLDRHLKNWNLEGNPSAYFLALHKVIQLQHGVDVRLASKTDVEERAGEREVAEAVARHRNWEDDEQKRRAANSAVIIKAFEDRATSPAGVRAFVGQYDLNTNQINALAKRATKCEPPVMLSKEAITQWAQVVHDDRPKPKPKPGESKTPVAELADNFYLGRKKNDD
ncbi:MULTISPECIES: hypothetical protein [unclassified Curtobacterium]|uniref:hypothetical protein n=1 Tax=unclassified Curtobacterium TaxID=257496 RepID=UPI00382228C9